MPDEELEKAEASGEISTAMLLVVLLVGAAFGAAVLFWNPMHLYPLRLHGWNESHREFAKTSPFILWAALMCAQTGVWLLILIWLGPSFRRVWPPKGKRRDLVGLRSEALSSTLVIVITIVVASAVLNPNTLYGTTTNAAARRDYMPGHNSKLEFLTAIGVIVGLLAAWGIWLTHAKITSLADRIERKEVTREGALHDFLVHQGRVKRFLGALGVILSLLVLATAANRQVVLAYDHKVSCAPTCPKPFQPIDYGYQFVLLYGLFFSILIAAVYLPTHLSLARAANQIRDSFFADVPPSAPEWQQRTADREKLGSLLELDVGPLGRLRASAAILTPLISGLVGLLLTS